MLLGMHIDDEGRRRMVDAYNAKAGNVRGEHVAAVMAHVADTRTEARLLLRTELPRWLGPGLAGYVPVDDRPYTPRDPDKYAELL